MGVLVEAEITGLQGHCKGGGLSEAEGKAFAGNSVDGAGGVTEKGDIAGGDAAEFAVERDGASRNAAGLRIGKAKCEGGEVPQGLVRAGEFIAGDEGDADLVRGVGCDVGRPLLLQ